MEKSLLGFVIVCERGVTNVLALVNVFLFLFFKIVHKANVAPNYVSHLVFVYGWIFKRGLVAITYTIILIPNISTSGITLIKSFFTIFCV